MSYPAIDHSGDFTVAATALRAEGEGDPGLTSSSPRPALAIDIQWFSDISEREITWLWPGVIPRGMLSIIGGKQGLGKSFQICDLAARISTGRPMPDGTINPPGKVLLLAREDDPSSVIKPRLMAAGADQMRVALSRCSNNQTGDLLDLASNVNLLTEETKPHAFDLIVVDTYAAFATAGTDTNAGQEVRLLLDALARLARNTGAAVVVIAHLRKAGQGDGDAMDAIAGSVQMTAGVRVAAILDKGRHDDERWFRVVKSNLGKINERGWTWRFAYPDPLIGEASEMPRIAWTEAGEAYSALEADRMAGRATIDRGEVQKVLVGILGKEPLKITAVVDRVWRKMRQLKGHKDLKKNDVTICIEDLAANSGDAFVVGTAPRGAKLIGLPGSNFESPEDRAYRIARESPAMKIRQLREAAGCRREVAAAALRDARDNMQEGKP